MGRYMRKVILFNVVLLTFIYAQKFEKINSLENDLKINFSSLEIEESKGNLVNGNNIPIISTFYQISNTTSINVEYEISNIDVNKNVNLSINNLVDQTGIQLDQDGNFPATNLIISDPMIFRGIPVVKVSFIPFKYNDYNSFQ